MSQDVNQDWASRNFVETIEVAMRKCVDFLNNFHEQAKYRLSEVDQRLISLERKVDFVEAQLLNADPSKRNAQPKSFIGSTFDPSIRREQVKKFRERLQKTEKVFSDRIIAPRKADSAGGKLIVGGPKKQSSQPQEILGAPKMAGKGNIPIAQMKAQKSKEQEAKAKAAAANAANNVQPVPSAMDKKKAGGPPPSAADAQKAMAAAQQAKQVPKQPQQPQPGPPPGPGGGAGPGGRAPPSAAEAAKAVAKQQQPPQQPPIPQPPGPPVAAAAQQAPPQPPIPQPPGPPQNQPPPPGPPGPPGGPGANQPGSGTGEGEGTYASDGPGAGFPHGDPGSIDLLIVTPGSGNVPGPNSKVEIEYIGFLPDGTKFIEHKEEISLGLKQNIKGLEAGVQRMQEGTEAKLWIPSKLAYGVRGAPPLIPGNSDLTFEIKLLRIMD